MYQSESKRRFRNHSPVLRGDDQGQYALRVRRGETISFNRILRPITIRCACIYDCNTSHVGFSPYPVACVISAITVKRAGSCDIVRKGHLFKKHFLVEC
jgi:hypothetical protein